MRQPAVPPRTRAELAVIHLGKKALRLDDDTYRDFLQQLTGRRSAKELSSEQRQLVIEAMRKRGFKQDSWGGLGSILRKVQRQGGARLRPHQAKVKALWRALWNLGELRDGGDEALDRWLRSDKGAGVEALRFADAKACNMAIEGLRDWCRRSGFETVSGESGLQAKRRLARAIWAKLVTLREARVAGPEGLDAWLMPAGVSPHKSGVDQLQAEQLDLAIEKLGAWLRKVQANREEGLS